jgi:dihydroorotate dehydrogenase
MPDWFYRTVTRPLLFRLPAVQARDFALGFMGRLGRLPLGPAVIDFLGHMRADPRLHQSFLGLDFPTAVGLGPGLDAHAAALPALARFGFGFVEAGPVTVEGSTDVRPIARRAGQEAVWSPDPPACLSLAATAPRLAEASRLGLPLIARLGAPAGAGAEQATGECGRMIRELAPHAHLFSLATLPHALNASVGGWSAAEWSAHAATVVDAARNASPPRPVLLCVPADLDERAEPLVDAAVRAGAGGLLVDGSVRATPDGRLVGGPAREPALDLVRRLRDRYERDLLLIAAGGVHEPADALALREAGADLVQVDTGVVYTGPGLPKRINDALLFADTRATAAPALPEKAPEMTWFWTALLGAGMLFGGLLAMVIAMTRVVLPYDEAFVGMSRAQLDAVNPRLLAFMSHDRVSLAGTMVAIGVMYLGLSLSGVRRGHHWAQQSVFISAATGFASFFLFLGFGYLDIFHSFVTAVLLQLLLLGIHSRLGTYTPDVAPPPRGDRAWRRALWGQLLLVLHGAGLLGAGLTISAIGVSHVFVPEDLEFMGTAAQALQAANPHLVPLVAHDRATLGGMLLASGWAFLLPALWGFRNGSAWLWWTMLLAGCSAYAAAIGIHCSVGYLSPMHLLPAFGGLGVFLLGLGLSASYLCGAGGDGSAVRSPETGRSRSPA